MIVPDKKTEAYLNEPVSPKGVLRLCRAGVLPSSDFLRAAALCRSDRKWGKFILLILRFLTGLSFLTAVFFIMVAKWSFFYQTGGFVLLAVLFVLCACVRSRSAVADYAGAALIGLMVFLPGLVFRTNSFLYEEFFLWFVLLAVWAIPSGRAGIRLTAFAVLNAAIFLYGVQFALPSFIFNATTFFILAAAFNLFCFVLHEFLPLQPSCRNRSCFRFFPLAGMMLFLSAAAGVQCFPVRSLNPGDVSFLLCCVCSYVCGYLYIIRIPDRTGRRLTGLFTVCWGIMLLYRLLYAFDFSAGLRQALFCAAVSALIAAALIRERLYVARVKGEKDAV